MKTNGKNHPYTREGMKEKKLSKWKHEELGTISQFHCLNEIGRPNLFEYTCSHCDEGLE
jgi:hypothetical protein